MEGSKVGCPFLVIIEEEPCCVPVNMLENRRDVLHSSLGRPQGYDVRVAYIFN